MTKNVVYNLKLWKIDSFAFIDDIIIIITFCHYLSILCITNTKQVFKLCTLLLSKLHEKRTVLLDYTYIVVSLSGKGFETNELILTRFLQARIYNGKTENYIQILCEQNFIIIVGNNEI